MADTSLQVHTWITKALHTDVWVRATQNVDDAITKCSQFPIESAEGAKARRAQWETLVKVIETTETTVKPLRSRIHDIRTELALRVNAVLDPAKDRASDVQRMLGAWDAQERVRVAAAEAERRKIEQPRPIAAVQKADGDRGGHVIDALDTRLTHQGSVFDADSPEAPEVALVDTIDPFTTSQSRQWAATAGPTGPTKKTWVVEILDADKLVRGPGCAAGERSASVRPACARADPTSATRKRTRARQGRGGESRHAGQRAVRGSGGPQP